MGRIRSRAEAGQEQSKSRVGEQCRSRAKQSRAEQGKKRTGAGLELDMCRARAWKEQGRSMARVGQKLELGRTRVGAEQEQERNRRVARWE